MTETHNATSTPRSRGSAAVPGSEFQQVAALVCMDLDTLKNVVDHEPNMTASEMKAHIIDTWMAKEEATRNPAARNARYRAAAALFGIQKTTKLTRPHE